ncbi:hypothetical protein NNO_0090 [Hydrogenimonas sp.]|nr:hypothetical protein NNO_0090 [Hydrogenimonas sp.]
MSRPCGEVHLRPARSVVEQEIEMALRNRVQQMSEEGACELRETRRR